jgi:selenocysteine-specific elongation factor
VVTGTLSDGKLATGDEVEILPSGLHGRIRGLQTHKKKEEMAVPGSRTAVNISSLDMEQIQRGEVVTHPGKYRTTQRMDLNFRLLKDVSASLRHHTEVKLFINTSETIADVRLLGTEILNPGESGWLQLELRTPMVAVRGDRYILRRPSPGETLGGGTVVDPQPKGRHKRFNKAVLKALEAMVQGSPAEVLLQAATSLGPVPVKEVIERSRLESSTAESALRELIDTGQVILLDNLVIPTVQWSLLKETVSNVLSAYHKAYPLRRGMPREELKSRLKLAPRLFSLILVKMTTEGLLSEAPKWVALPGHIVCFSPFQQVKVDKLLAMFEAAPYAPPSVKECLAEVGEDIFNTLRESGDLVTVSDEVVFRKTDYEKMVARIRQALQQKGKITLAEVRDLLNTSRKYVQALLEYLDAIGITARDGDYRKLRI